MKIVHTPTAEMIADLLTKPIQGVQFVKLRQLLMQCKVTQEFSTLPNMTPLRFMSLSLRQLWINFPRQLRLPLLSSYSLYSRPSPPRLICVCNFSKFFPLPSTSSSFDSHQIKGIALRISKGCFDRGLCPLSVPAVEELC
jgi:hypothetical protein